MAHPFDMKKWLNDVRGLLGDEGEISATEDNYHQVLVQWDIEGGAHCYAHCYALGLDEIYADETKAAHDTATALLDAYTAP